MVVVAISSGNFSDHDTIGIDRRIVDLRGTQPKRVLFVPTAQHDPQSYVDVFSELYEGELGCDVRTLEVFDESSRNRVDELLDWASIVYVGGGSTDLLLAAWRAYGIDAKLLRLCQTDKVFCGMSAGAICWFDYGFANVGKVSPADPRPRYSEVSGLGLVPGTYSPHIESELRMLSLVRHVEKTARPAYAAMDRTAICYASGRIETLACDAAQSIYELTPDGGSVRVTQLPMTLV